ncbi:hypothetical protein [uncultured Fibrobacter sp.]|uniref:hypothetical protein n=1 Tax=Fibrobacter intestinalis TaxID=28122 RepID=UPI00099A8527|nr:hypothetical protein [uncultured Fibrobacter sp.]
MAVLRKHQSRVPIAIVRAIWQVVHIFQMERMVAFGAFPGGEEESSPQAIKENIVAMPVAKMKF